MTVESPLRFVGLGFPRPDGRDKVIGSTRYVADLPLPGLVHARFVRSPHAAARIREVRTARAQELPGVVGVFTVRDLPVPDAADLVTRQRIPLALDRVWYAGQAVAVVVAESPALAEDAAALVEVDYEPLPAVVDPEVGAAAGAPAVREQWSGNDEELAAHGAAGQAAEAADGKDDAPQSPNVSNLVHFEHGDVEAALARSDARVELELRTSWIHQSYLEPQACVATPDEAGRLVVYVSHQALFSARDDIADSLGLSTDQVVVRAMPVGGAFGGKWGLLEVLAAALVRKLHRPVRVEYDRMDELLASTPAPAARFRLRAGARSDGTLLGLDAEILYDSGSKPSTPLWLTAVLLGSTYRWEAVRIDGSEVLTNRLGGGAYRGPGAPQAAFAVEAVIDELARQLGRDPLEMRLRNAVREGDRRVDGATWPRIGAIACLQRARPVYEAERRAAGPNEGVGIALGSWPGGSERAEAICRLTADGSLDVELGTVDLNGTDESFRIIAAEAFGLEHPTQVRIRSLDSASAPYAGGTGGSKITYSVGPAVHRAALEARRQVLAIAAEALEAAPEDLEIRDGHVQVAGVPTRRLALAEIARLASDPLSPYQPVVGRGESDISHASPQFSVQVVRVAVDPESGLVTPRAQYVIQDVGRVIYPPGVTGQLLGGAVQALGWGLFERMAWDDAGTPLTTTLADYMLPTSADVPAVEPVCVEVPSEDGPYGAKGVGESCVIPGAAAVANAVRDATGCRLTELPLTPERVYRAITQRC